MEDLTNSKQSIDVTVLADEVFRGELSIGVPVRVLREGMFIFDFSAWEPGRPLPVQDDPGDFDVIAAIALRRSTLMNAHLACLYTAIARLQDIAPQGTMVVTPSELITINSFEESWGGTGGDTRLSALSQARFASTYGVGLPPCFDWRLMFRFPTVEVPTLEESFRLLNTITNHSSESLLDTVDLYMRGCRAQQDHNYSLALVMMWTICEQLLQKLWRRYLNDNRQRELDGNKVPFVTRERKKALEDSRTFSASVVSEMLSLVGRLPLHLYKELTKARKTRNRWVHDLAPVSREAAQSSVKAAEQMLRFVEGVDLEIPLNLSLHG